MRGWSITNRRDVLAALGLPFVDQSLPFFPSQSGGFGWFWRTGGFIDEGSNRPLKLIRCTVLFPLFVSYFNGFRAL